MHAGWAWPLAARKAHYFAQEQIISLCGKWMYTGTRDDDNGKPSPDDCVACRRKLEAQS